MFQRVSGYSGLVAYLSLRQLRRAEGTHHDERRTVTNWSDTHSTTPSIIYEPHSIEDVVSVLHMHHALVLIFEYFDAR